MFENLKKKNKLKKVQSVFGLSADYFDSHEDLEHLKRI